VFYEYLYFLFRFYSGGDLSRKLAGLLSFVIELLCVSQWCCCCCCCFLGG